MTKRLISVCYLLLAAAAMLSAVSLNAEAESLPTSIKLSWDAVDGAVYYDIYNGQTSVARLPSDVYSFTVEDLFSNESYDLCVAARDAENRDLDAEWVTASTTNWDGVYQWVNETDKDNRGRMKTFTLRLETVRDEAIGQYLRMFMVNDDGSELRIFPLFDFGSENAGSWVDYGDDGPTGTAYRENAERFNTSIFKPSKWRVDRIVIDYDSTSAYIQTSAFGIIVDTETTYYLYIEDGLRKMSFTTTSESSLAESVLFHNPNPGEGDAFILTEI